MIFFLKLFAFYIIFNFVIMINMQSDNIWHMNDLMKYIEDNLKNYKEKYILLDPDNLVTLENKNFLNYNIKEIYKKYKLSLFILFLNKFEKDDFSSIDDKYFFDLSIKIYNHINKFINNNNSILCYFDIKNEKFNFYSNIYTKNFYTNEKLNELKEKLFLNFILKKYNKLFNELIFEINQLALYSYNENIYYIDDIKDDNSYYNNQNEKEKNNNYNETSKIIQNDIEKEKNNNNETSRIIPKDIEGDKNKKKIPNIYNKKNLELNIVIIILLSIIVLILFIILIRLCKKIKKISYNMTNYSIFEEKYQENKHENININ